MENRGPEDAGLSKLLGSISSPENANSKQTDMQAHHRRQCRAFKTSLKYMCMCAPYTDWSAQMTSQSIKTFHLTCDQAQMEKTVALPEAQKWASSIAFGKTSVVFGHDMKPCHLAKYNNPHTWMLIEKTSSNIKINVTNINTNVVTSFSTSICTTYRHILVSGIMFQLHMKCHESIAKQYRWVCLGRV